MQNGLIVSALQHSCSETLYMDARYMLDNVC